MRRAAVESLAFAGVAALAFVRFGAALVAPGHPNDEAKYFEGFARYAAGLDPYALRDVLFPPSFAWLGSALVSMAGEGGAALCLRALTLAGIAATACLAAAATERPLRDRSALAALAVLVFPPFAHAVSFGNVGPAATALALAALALLPRRPYAAAPALGISLALKPIGAALVPLLAAWRGGDGRRRLPPAPLAATLAAALAGALVLAAGPELLTSYLARNAEVWRAPFQLGFVRAAAELGLELPTWLPAAAIVLLAALWAWRGRPGGPLFRAVAPALALAAVPIVWLHTLALALPLQLRALVGPRAFAAGLRRPLEIALRLALCATTWGAGAVGAIDAAPAVVRAAIAALPLVAVLLLATRCVADDAPA